MKTAESSPGLLQDLGSIAGLYRTVFWMVGKRIQYGPNWEERLTEEALHHPLVHQEPANPAPPTYRHN